MELLVALLTLFRVEYTQVDRNTVRLNWEGEEPTIVYNSEEYDLYVDQGGTELFDVAGTPAIHVIVKDVKK